MATHDYNIGNGSGLDVRTDLNAVLSAILSQNSNASAPTATVGGMFWYDTTTSILKQRNNTDDAWLDKWDTTKGMLATLASPTFSGIVNLPLTTLLNGTSIAITASPTFTGTSSFVNLSASGTVSLPSTTSIGVVSSAELSYLDGATSAIQGQLDAKQATLVSGTNIKTVAGQSIVGGGNISIPTDTISSIFANSQTFTASGTFTVPAGVTRLIVYGCAGGGGGGGGGVAGGDGGNTIFGSLTFYGGGGGSSSGANSTAGQCAGGRGGTGGGTGSSGGSAGKYGNGAGGGEGYGGIGASTAPSGAGSGGGGGGRTATITISSGGGGSSSFTEKIITVTPLSVLNVTIGGGGAGGAANGYIGGVAGIAGKVIVYW